jgi:hypothetical protein
MRPQNRDAVRAQRQGHADRSKRRSPRGGAGRPHVVGRRDRPGESADGGREPAFQAGHLGIVAYANSSTRRRSRRCGLAAHGLPVDRQPSFVLRPMTRGDLDGSGASLSARPDPGLATVAQHRRRARHRRWPSACRPEGQVGERYILAGRNFTLDRLFADFARISVANSPGKAAGTPHGVRRAGHGLAGLPLPVSPDEVQSATLWWTYRNTKAGSWAERPTRRHPRCGAGRMDQLGDRVRTGEARRRRPRGRRPLLRLEGGCSGVSGKADGEGEGDRLVPLPEPHQRALPVRGGRPPARQTGARAPHQRFPIVVPAPEIAELTRQTRVPVLVDGDRGRSRFERILQYLDWKYEGTSRKRKPGRRRTLGRKSMLMRKRMRRKRRRG